MSGAPQDAGPDIAAVAALLGDATRTRMLTALVYANALPASELARMAGISRSTASEHLAKLVNQKLLSVERCGRHSYYRLAGPQIADALEVLAAIAPEHPITSLRASRQARAIGQARTCYDHVAGALGVQIADSLENQGLIRSWTEGFAVEQQAWEAARPLGVSCEPVGRRALTRACLDWSERRHHLAGSLGAALTSRLLELGWVGRSSVRRRVLVVSDAGRQGLGEAFGIDVPEHLGGELAQER